MKLLLAATLALSATAAAADDLSVRIKDGATWTITAEHTRKAGDLVPAQNWSVTTVKRLTWRAGRAGAPATLLVTPVSATPGAGSPPEIAQARSLAIPATLTVDEDLTPGDVVNRDEVRAEFVRLVPNAKGADAKLVDTSARAMIAAELATVARGQGLPLKPGPAVSAEIALANPLGGPPLRGVETGKLEARDDVAGIAKIRWTQVADPDAFKAMVSAMIADLGKGKLSPDKLAEAKAAFQGAAYDSRTECLFEIDTRTGLARQADCTGKTTLTMQGKTQQIVDTWAITQTLPDNS